MSNWRRYEPFLMGGGKIDPIYDIRNAGIVTEGDVYWVKSSTDSDYTTLGDAVGKEWLFGSAQGAVDEAASDNNDYILVTPTAGGTDHLLGTALDLNEDRLHIIGVGHSPKPRSYGVTLRANYGTSPDTEVVAITGQGVEVAGIRLLGTLGTHAGGTMSNGIMYLGTASTGTAHDLWVHDSVLEMSGAHGTPPLLAGLEANDARFDDVAFLAGIESHIDPVIMPHSSARWEFHDCRFVIDAQATGNQFVTAGTGAIDYLLFKGCQFVNRESGTAPASVVTGSVTIDNAILMHYCTGVNVTAFGTDAAVYCAPNQSGTAGAGIHNPGIFLIGSAAISAA